MLHALKKKVTIARSTASGELHLPPEVASLKLKLGSVKKRISETITWVESANANVKVKVAEQAAFSKAYSRSLVQCLEDGPGSPTGRACVLSESNEYECESTRVARRFAEQSELVYNTHCKSGSPDPKSALYKQLLGRLKAYVAAIAVVEAKYPRLTAIRSESTRYNSKFDSMIVKRGVDDLKISRNLDKSDSCRSSYRDMRDAILAEQRALFARASLAMKASIVLYWGTFERTTSLMQLTFQETEEWAKENLQELAAVKISRAEHIVSSSSPALSDAMSESDHAGHAMLDSPMGDVIPNKLTTPA